MLLAFQKGGMPVPGVDRVELVENRQADAAEAAGPCPVPGLLNGLEVVGHHQMNRRPNSTLAESNSYKA